MLTTDYPNISDFDKLEDDSVYSKDTLEKSNIDTSGRLGDANPKDKDEDRGNTRNLLKNPDKIYEPKSISELIPNIISTAPTPGGSSKSAR